MKICRWGILSGHSGEEFMIFIDRNQLLTMDCIVAAQKLRFNRDLIERCESQSIKIISRIMPGQDPKIVFSHLWPLQKLSVLSQAMIELKDPTFLEEHKEWSQYKAWCITQKEYSEHYEIMPEALFDIAFKGAGQIIGKQQSPTKSKSNPIDQIHILYVFEEICDHVGWDKTAVINKQQFFAERSQKLLFNRFSLV